MTEETLTPVDPLADDEDNDILPPLAEEVAVTDTAEIVEEPTAEIKVDNSRPVFTPIDETDEIVKIARKRCG